MKYLKTHESFKKPTVISTAEYVAVQYEINNRLASCEISNLKGEWYVNRVKVPNGQEGKGIGSIILQKAINEIKKHNPKSIYVTPGGYHADEEKQFNFYKKNGFIEMEGIPELLYYKEYDAPSDIL